MFVIFPHSKCNFYLKKNVDSLVACEYFSGPDAALWTGQTVGGAWQEGAAEVFQLVDLTGVRAGILNVLLALPSPMWA